MENYSYNPSSDNPLPIAPSGIGRLFSETWKLFKEKYITLVLIIIIGVVSLIVASLLVGLVAGLGNFMFENMPAVRGIYALIVSLVGALGLLFLFHWLYAAFLVAVTVKGATLKESFKLGLKKWLGLLWVLSLVTFIIFGAFFTFIIPGILFAIWLYFATYSFITDDSKGMDSLLKSKFYIDGRFWKVVLFLFVLWSIGFVISLIPFVGRFINLLGYMPFSLVAAFILFRELSATKSGADFVPSSKLKAGLLGTAIAGYLIAILLIVTAVRTGFFDRLAAEIQRQVETEINVPPPTNRQLP